MITQLHMQKLSLPNGKECQYLTILVFNKLHFYSSTKLFVTVQNVFAFDTAILQAKKLQIHFQLLVLWHICSFASCSFLADRFLFTLSWI